MEKTDEEIALRVQGGDTDLFGILVERYEYKMIRYANKFLLREQAGDLAQEVFIKAFINIRSFDTERKFSSWLYRIAHNEFINAIRKKSRESLLYFFDADTIFPHPIAKENPENEARRKETKAMVDKYLNQIGLKYREPLVLFYFEELEYAEIAEILHIPVSTVGVRLVRGREALKKLIDHHEQR